MKLPPPPIFVPEPIAEPSANPLAKLLLAEESPIEEIEILLEEQLAWLHVTRPDFITD